MLVCVDDDDSSVAAKNLSAHSRSPGAERRRCEVDVPQKPAFSCFDFAKRRFAMLNTNGFVICGQVLTQ
jgi:hypothetical protein